FLFVCFCFCFCFNDFTLSFINKNTEDFTGVALLVLVFAFFLRSVETGSTACALAAGLLYALLTIFSSFYVFALQTIAFFCFVVSAFIPRTSSSSSSSSPDSSLLQRAFSSFYVVVLVAHFMVSASPSPPPITKY